MAFKIPTSGVYLHPACYVGSTVNIVNFIPLTGFNHDLNYTNPFTEVKGFSDIIKTSSEF